MIMLSDTSGTRPHERLDSDRESLPFPAGGVFGRPAEHDTKLDTTIADDILETIDRMKAGLDAFEHALAAELIRELEEQVEIAGRIGCAQPDGWPPAAA